VKHVSLAPILYPQMTTHCSLYFNCFIFSVSQAEALKAFCFVSVSVILPKHNPVSVKLPFPY
jgi:hypothetical protein